MEGRAETYKVKLHQFEGPLDLLLHLIRRDKINIYDIPISHITSEYLAYIEVMKELELEIAGEFFVMAATLIRIKAQMLLPRRVDDDEDEEDPREELVRNLIEYRRFKEVAGLLARKEEERRKIFPRAPISPINLEPIDDSIDVSLFDLIDAFKKVISNLKVDTVYTIEKESVTIEEKMEHITEILKTRNEVLFSELFSSGFSRMDIIVTFLALLELVRLGEVNARQMADGSDIWLYSKKAVGL